MKNIRTKPRFRLFCISSAILLAVVTAISLFFFFCLNSQLAQLALASQFTAKYHAKVYGNFRHKLWHGLGFEAKDIVVTNSSNDKLLHIKTISVQLSWPNLIIGRYVVSRLSLNGVDINETAIIKNNAYDMLAMGTDNTQLFGSLDHLDISNINSVDVSAPHPIKNGQLCIKRHYGTAYFNLGFELSNEENFVLLNGNISAVNADTIRLGDFTASVYGPQLNVAVTSDASYYIHKQRLVLQNIQGNLTLGKYFGNVGAEIAKFSLNSASAENIHFNLHTAKDFTNEHLQIDLNHLSYLGYKQLQVETINTQYELNIDQNKIDLNSTLKKISTDAVSGTITSDDCNNTFALSSPNLGNKGVVHANLYGVCSYNLRVSTLFLDLAGDLNQAPVKVSLHLIDNANKPQILVAGDIANLDLSPLRMQPDSSKLVASYDDTSPLPFSWISLFDMTAHLKIQHFVLDRIKLDDVITNFTLKRNTLDITSLQAKVYGGTLNGRAQITKESDAHSYDIHTNEEIYSLDLKSLFGDLFNVGAISGLANIRVNTTNNGVMSYQDLHKKLNGQIVVNANHGAFQGVDFNLFVAPTLTPSMTKSTMFEQLQAKFDFVNGVSSTGNVVFYSPYVIADGTGTIDFVNTKLNYLLTIKSALPQNKQKISRVVIPVAATGDLFAPTISIQNIHLLTGKSKVLLKHKDEHIRAKTSRHLEKDHGRRKD